MYGNRFRDAVGFMCRLFAPVKLLNTIKIFCRSTEYTELLLNVTEYILEIFYLSVYTYEDRYLILAG